MNERDDDKSPRLAGRTHDEQLHALVESTRERRRVQEARWARLAQEREQALIEAMPLRVFVWRKWRGWRARLAKRVKG